MESKASFRPRTNYMLQDKNVCLITENKEILQNWNLYVRTLLAAVKNAKRMG